MVKTKFPQNLLGLPPRMRSLRRVVTNPWKTSPARYAHPLAMVFS